MKKDAAPFIFYLTLDEKLPNTFYIFAHWLKESDFILVPVRIDQLQTLVASTEQDQVIVLSSVTDAREYKLYNEKVRKLLKLVLKSKRISYFQLSSFSRLSDNKQFATHNNYFFMKYPISAKTLCQKLTLYHSLKKAQSTLWPGGKRATLSTEGL